MGTVKRLAFVVLDGGLGGHTRTSVAIATGMRARGYEVVFFLGEKSPDKVVTGAGFTPERVHHAFRTDLYEQLKAKGPFTAIHTFSTLGLVELVAFGKQTQTPVVYTRCGGPPVKEPIEVRMMRALQLPRFTVLSDENKQELLPTTGASPENVLVLPARIDVAAMQASQKPELWQAFRERVKLAPTTKILLRIARIGPAYEESIRQGILTAVELNRRGLDAAFVHIGYADVATIAETLYAEIESANQAAGRMIAVSDQEVSMNAQAHVGMGDAVAGMGRSAFEGLAVGRPTLVAGKVGFGGLVTPETVTALAQFNFSGRNGQTPLTREESVQAMADTCERLFTDAEYAQQVSAYSLQYADEHLDTRHSLDAYERLYHDFNPELIPADDQIRAAMRLAVLKRGLRNMLSKGFRSQVSGIINLRHRPKPTE